MLYRTGSFGASKGRGQTVPPPLMELKKRQLRKQEKLRKTRELKFLSTTGRDNFVTGTLMGMILVRPEIVCTEH